MDNELIPVIIAQCWEEAGSLLARNVRDVTKLGQSRGPCPKCGRLQFRSRCSIPLRLGRQAKADAAKPPGPVVPTDLLDGMPQIDRVLGHSRVEPTHVITAWIHPIEARPLTLGHLVLRDQIRCEHNLADRGLVGPRLRIEVGLLWVPLRPHPEGAARDQN